MASDPAAQAESPLVSPEEIKQRDRFAGLADVDELLVAMLQNQQHFYSLFQNLGLGGVSQTDLEQELDDLDTTLDGLNATLSQLAAAVGDQPTLAAVKPWNFRVNNFDLNKRDWVLSSEREDEFPGPVPDVQGADEVALFFESDDDEAFEVKVRFVDEAGNTRTEVDQNVDAELASTSPGGTNHHVFVTVAITDRLTDIVISDTSGNKNRVDGNFNFH